MSEAPLSKIKFDYIKSNFFRTARADGAWAATNGFSDVVLNFYSERTPIPKHMVYPVTEEHRLGEEILAERILRDAMVREVEISLSMSLGVAQSLRDLLTKQIKALETEKSERDKK